MMKYRIVRDGWWYVVETSYGGKYWTYGNLFYFYWSARCYVKRKLCGPKVLYESE